MYLYKYMTDEERETFNSTEVWWDGEFGAAAWGAIYQRRRITTVSSLLAVLCVSRMGEGWQE
jgi:hypothetical protein